MSLDQRIARVFDRHRRPAVLLHRPYPPTVAPRTNSWFGGLPGLPERYDWPRTSDGLPLHFLAQVDCADIPLPSALPARGVLFFFARDDEEQIWELDRPAAESVQVIYALDAFAATPPRAAPADLHPIGGHYPRPHSRPLLREGEPGPPVHPRWPIQPLPMDTWPDVSALGVADTDAAVDWSRFAPGRWRESEWDATVRLARARQPLLDRYLELLEARRDSTWRAATGTPAHDREGALFPSADEAIRLFGTDADEHRFPDRWLGLDLFCRALRASHAPDPDRVAVAEGWLSCAAAAKALAPVPDGERAAFRDWVRSMRHPDSPLPMHAPASTWMMEALLGSVRRLAGDPAAARLVPDRVYAALSPWFENGSVWSLSFAQMLGHAPSSQDARAVDDPTICLLNLPSDPGLGWMFGDMGEATFWIDPDALARRDFSRAWATIEGH